MDKVRFNCMVADYAAYTSGSDVSLIARECLKLEAKLAKATEALEFYSQRKHLDWIGSSELYTRKECEIDAWELAKNFLSIEMGNKARTALKELADEDAG